MADKCSDTDMWFLVNALEKLSSVPPLWPETAKNFTVIWRNENLVVQASSAFESATKFAFCLNEFGYLLSDSVMSSEIEVLDENSDKYIYNVTLHDNIPSIELNFVLKNTTSRYDLNDEPSSTVNTPRTRSVVDLERDELIDNTLKHYFGFTGFRPLQRETIVATMKGDDVLTVVGTGGGKSLTYLLPSVISEKTTFVIAPTKSLIDDIIDSCGRLEISSCKFTGDIPKEVQECQLLNLPKFKVVVVTPEMLEEGELINALYQLVEKDKLDRIVFDEAHTIVSWGNTFRPVYKQVCEKLANILVPKLLLSATVTGKLEAELKTIFSALTVLRTSVFRENLFLEVKERTSKFYDEVKDFILEHKNESGIIYCVLPKDVATVHAELLKRGVESVKYHGQ